MRRTTAGGDAQAARRCDWAHWGSIGGGGLVGEGSSERRRRGCGDASTPARIPVTGGKMHANKWLWQLSLGPRRGAQLLGWRCERADGRARRGGGNGRRRSRVRARGGSAALFIGAGSTEVACGLCLEARGGELWRGAQRPRRTGLAGGRRGGGSGWEHGREWERVPKRLGRGEKMMASALGARQGDMDAKTTRGNAGTTRRGVCARSGADALV
jgi:hypothetical protein